MADVRQQPTAPAVRFDVPHDDGAAGPSHGLRRLRLWATASIVGAYGLLFATTLRFHYVEGDDAASIAFHTAGRDSALMRPFSSYHAGADLLLSLLPTSEPVLRVSAIAVSAALSVVAVLLMLELVRTWLEGTPRLHDALVEAGPWTIVILSLAILAAAPELLFLSLVYLPSMIAYALILAAHVSIRRVVEHEGWRRHAVVALGCVATGLGVSVRWDLSLVAIVGVVDLVFLGTRRGLMPRIRAVIVAWALGSVAVFGLVLVASPSAPNLSSVFEVLGGRAGAETSVRNAVLYSMALFTPALLMLCAWGLVALDRSWRRFAVGQLAFAAALAVFLNWSVPKVFLAFLPALFLAVLAGMIDLWQRATPKLVVVGFAILLVPWIVGVQVGGSDTAWGPGFEIQPYDREVVDDLDVDLNLGVGTALPNPEGPRSIWGYGAVLYGGGWAGLVEERAVAHAAALDLALDMELPLLQAQGSPGTVIATLAGRGIDPIASAVDYDGFKVKRLAGQQAEVLLVDLDQFDDFDEDPAISEAIIAATGKTSMVIFGNSSAMRSLYVAVPAAMSPLGPEAAVIDLEVLTATLVSG